MTVSLLPAVALVTGRPSARPRPTRPGRTGSSSQPCPRSPAGSPVGPPLVAPGSQCSESLAPVGQTSPAQPSHDHDRRCEPFLSEYDCLACKNLKFFKGLHPKPSWVFSNYNFCSCRERRSTFLVGGRK